MKTKKKIPKFQDENQEQEFWSSADSTEYIDWSKSKKLMAPKLKPSLKLISIRLPENIIYRLKQKANKLDIPYQSLIKIILQEKIEQ
jgi:predicted DNA binding CopG/RHH family protein